VHLGDPQDSQLCVRGCCNVESVGHLFMLCDFFGSHRHFVYNWLGFSSANPAGILDQLL